MLPEPQIEVEIATTADWIEIAHLNVWAYREFSVELGPYVWPEMVRLLTAVQPAAGTATFLVVRDGDVLVGSAAYRPPGDSVNPVPPAWASIDLLAVAPPVRNVGIGKALVHACLELARSDGAQMLGAPVNGLLTAAQGLFTGLGFHREQGLARRGEQPPWLYRREL